MGCGAVLQIDDKTKQGYVLSEVIDKAKYCYRCFRIMHYNDKLIMPVEGINDYVLKEVNKRAKLVFFLIDLLSINKEVIETFKKIEGKKVLVISKLDILPKSFKKGKIGSWLKDIYGIKEEIIFISTLKDLHIMQIEKLMEKYQQNFAFVLGYSNAGKSTLINKLLLKRGNQENRITTSMIPNTTLDFIEILLDEDKTICDAPGFVLSDSFKKDNLDFVAKVNTRKEIRPRTYQVKAGSSIIIEEELEIIPESQVNMTCYFSNEIKIEKNFSPSTVDAYKVEVLDGAELVIKGLGFISFKIGQKLLIKGIDRNLIEIRKAMF